MGIGNCFGVLPRFASERVKRRFLISNVSASNRTLVRGEHFCRELRVERVRFRDSSMPYSASILRSFTLGHKHPLLSE